MEVPNKDAQQEDYEVYITNRFWIAGLIQPCWFQSPIST